MEMRTRRNRFAMVFIRDVPIAALIAASLAGMQ